MLQHLYKEQPSIYIKLSTCQYINIIYFPLQQKAKNCNIKIQTVDSQI
jgi:hypothetical protein